MAGWLNILVAGWLNILGLVFWPTGSIKLMGQGVL